ncbi:MAG: nucleoside recognition protein [Firmicutes bacterium]|nr:nucleoside recognition protein [Bacillota bacterium]
MDIINLIFNTTLQTLLSIGKIALILIPVLMVIELAKHYQVIEKFTGKMKGFLSFLTLPEEAAFPLLAGIFFGIVLGSALIIDYAREGILKKRDLLLIGIYLSISHSIVEDTFIFAVFGANPAVLIITRTVLAIMITRIAAGLFDHFLRHQTAAATEKDQTVKAVRK